MKKLLTFATTALALTLSACSNSTGRTIPQAIANQNVEALMEPSAPPPSPSGAFIDWSIMPRNNYVLRDGNNETFLYLSLKSGANERASHRVPLNISLVLDRSGSMAGEKIAYAKRAAKFVIDQLGPEDIVSIVNYDDRVEVTSPQQYVRNKEALKNSIDRLMDRGSTNLTGGLMEGYKQVQSMKREGYVNRVLLLTDGLANIGIIQPAEIKRLVAKKFNDQGIALSTFGLGADYNEDLLTAMAEVGGANYYFIAEAEKIPNIFDQELKGLLSVLGQDAVVTISMPPGTLCEKVYGYPYQVMDGKITIQLNDIYANEEKGALIKLRSNRMQEGLAINATLAYTEAESFRKIRESKSLRLPITQNRTEFKAGVNKIVEEKVAMFEANDEFDAIMAEVDKGNYQEAKKRAAGSLSKLKAQQATAPSAALQDREVQITKYTEALINAEDMGTEDKSILQKTYKSINYESKKLKR